MSPLEIVEIHFAAYNKRDLAAYMATVTEDVEIFRHPDTQASMRGKKQISEFYRNQRFNLPGLNAQLLNRMVLGQTVIDHERVWGLQPEPVEAIIGYDIEEGLIRRIWLLGTGPASSKVGSQ